MRSRVSYKSILFFVLYASNIGFVLIMDVFDLLGNDLYGLILLTTLSLTLIIIYGKYLLKFINERRLFFILIFTLYCFVSASLGPAPLYGLQKLVLGFILPIAIYGVYLSKKWTEEIIIYYIILFTLLILIIGFFYKINFGFFDRSVRYGLLGPIPFGWINAFALILILTKESKRINDFIMSFIFFLAVLWSGSKGPVISLVVTAILFRKNFFGEKVSKKVTHYLLIVLIFGLVIVYGENFRSISSIINLFSSPEDYIDGAGAGSVGMRIIFLEKSLQTISNNFFFGTGFGGWSNYVEISEFKYPHNIVIELWSEIGFIGITLFMCLIYQFIRFGNRLFIASVSVFIMLLFSGDFTYFRYGFLPLLISFSLGKHPNLKQSNNYNTKFRITKRKYE